MKPGISLGIIFILILNIISIKCQSEYVQCRYHSISIGYICELIIQNPNGLNNFEDIFGDHIERKTDDDVEYIYTSMLSNSTNIPSIICNKFKNIKDFIASSNGLRIVDVNAFQTCTNLKSLRIQSDDLKQVQEKSFANLDLTSFTINSKSLKQLPGKLLSKQRNLITLSITETQISDFSNDTFANLRSLSELNLSNNKLKVLNPDWFKSLKNLNSLILENNEIEDLPKFIFSEQKKLNYLAIGNNKIQVVHSESFGNLSALTSVGMDKNRISAIDERFYRGCKNVYSFYLMFNKCIADFIMNSEENVERLSECFENYETLESGCSIYNTDMRVCKLENDNQKLIENLATTAELRSEVKNLQLQLQKLQSQVLELALRN